MSLAADSNSFFVSGGTLPLTAPSYIERGADQQLYDSLIEGKFCYVLNSRQMGKSSLCVRAMSRLTADGVSTVFIDLTRIGGQNVTAEQWYLGLASEIGRQLGATKEVRALWAEFLELSPMQRFFNSLRDVALPKVEKLVIFIDEIDATRGLQFSVDEFFAGIRECYNRRVHDPLYSKLSFCLLGVAVPSDLIQDARTTPFNIGERITLADFTSHEELVLVEGLSKAGRELVDRVHFWTNGHPYLTQSICAKLAKEGANGHADVDALVAATYFRQDSTQTNINLADVANRILNSYENQDEADLYRADILHLYEKVLRKRYVADDEGNRLVVALKLSGLTRVQDGRIVMRNRIYEKVFDRAWIAENMPFAERRRQSKAFYLGVLRTAVVGVLAVAMVSSLAIAAVIQSRRADAASVVAHHEASRAEEQAGEATRQRTRAEDFLRKQTSLSSALQSSLRETKAQRDRAQVAQLQATELASRLAGALSVAKTERAIAETARDKEATQRERAAQLLYAANLNLASKEWEMGAARQARDLLVAVVPKTKEPDRRGFDWRYQWEQLVANAVPQESIEPARANLVFTSKDSLAALDSNGALLRIDWESRRVLRMGPRYDSPALYSFDEKGKILAAAYLDRTVRFYRVGETRPFKTIRTSGSLPLRMVLSGEGSVLTYQDAKGIHSYLLREGRWLAQALTNNDYYDVSPDGRWIIARAQNNNGSATVYDLRSGRETGVSLPMNSTIRTIRIAPNSSTVAISGSSGELRLFQIAEGVVLSNATLASTTAIQGIAFSPDMRMIATGASDGYIQLWTIRDSKLVSLRGLPGHGEWVTVLRFSPDSSRLVSMTDLGEVRTWNMEDLAPKLRATALEVSFSTKGDLAATAGSGFKVFDPASGRVIREWPAPAARVGGAISPDGKQVVITSLKQSGVYDVASGRKVCDIETVPNPTFWDDPESVEYSRDGKLLAVGYGVRGSTGGQQFGYVRVFETAHYRQVVRLTTFRAPVTRVCFAPDGQSLGCASQDGSLHVFNVALWKEKYEIPMPGTVNSVAFSPDSKVGAAGNSRGQLTLFEVPTGKVRSEFLAHQDTISAVTFSPDGRSMLTGSKDRTIKLWDRASGLMTLTVPNFASDVLDAEFSPQNDAILIGPGNGILRGAPLNEMTGWLRQFSKFQPRDSQKLLADARARAKVAHRSVFAVVYDPVDGSRSWALKRYIERPSVKAILDRHFETVVLHGIALYSDRGIPGVLRAANLPVEGPSFILYGADGKVIANSSVERQGRRINIGLPEQDFEIAHFLDVMRQGGVRNDELAVLGSVLKGTAR